MHPPAKHQAVRGTGISSKIIDIPGPAGSGRKPASNRKKKTMHMRQSRSLVQYLVLALVLSAIFLAVMYSSDLKLGDDPAPEAVTTQPGPLAHSPTPDTYEQRFRQLEQWLGQTQDTYEARFEQLEQRLVKVTAPDNERLAKVEQQLAQVIDPQAERLRNIETRIAQTTSRLDELSVTLAALAEDTTTVVAANKALRIAPPAALQDPPQTGTLRARPQPRLSSDTATNFNTGSLAENKSPDVGTSPRQGKWAINIASYVSKKTAARKMDSFQKKGIAAEMVTANVHGQTIYRVRLPGFDTVEEAKAMVPTVKRQLGLKETWIMPN